MIRAWVQSGVREEVWKGQSHHAFRKGFSTGLRKSGADSDAVEYLLGHSLGLKGVYTAPEAWPLQEAVNHIPPIGQVPAQLYPLCTHAENT